jgi:hypothetical protein
MLVNNVALFYLSLNAAVVHFKNAFVKNQKFCEVEDVVHFLLVIEIATYSTSLIVIIIVLFFASIINQK